MFNRSSSRGACCVELVFALLLCMETLAASADCTGVAAKNMLIWCDACKPTNGLQIAIEYSFNLGTTLANPCGRLIVRRDAKNYSVSQAAATIRWYMQEQSVGFVGIYNTVASYNEVVSLLPDMNFTVFTEDRELYYNEQQPSNVVVVTGRTDIVGYVIGAALSVQSTSKSIGFVCLYSTFLSRLAYLGAAKAMITVCPDCTMYFIVVASESDVPLLRAFVLRNHIDAIIPFFTEQYIYMLDLPGIWTAGMLYEVVDDVLLYNGTNSTKAQVVFCSVLYNFYSALSMVAYQALTGKFERGMVSIDSSGDPLMIQMTPCRFSCPYRKAAAVSAAENAFEKSKQVSFRTGVEFLVETVTVPEASASHIKPTNLQQHYGPGVFFPPTSIIAKMADYAYVLNERDLTESYVFPYRFYTILPLWMPLTLAVTPPPRRGAAAVYVAPLEQVFIVMGTALDGTPLYDVWRMSASKLVRPQASWSQDITVFPRTMTPREGHTLTYDYDNTLYLFGGNSYDTDLWAYDITTGVWSARRTGLSPRMNHSAAYFNATLTLGGITSRSWLFMTGGLCAGENIEAFAVVEGLAYTLPSYSEVVAERAPQIVAFDGGARLLVTMREPTLSDACQATRSCGNQSAVVYSPVQGKWEAVAAVGTGDYSGVSAVVLDSAVSAEIVFLHKNAFSRAGGLMLFTLTLATCSPTTNFVSTPSKRACTHCASGTFSYNDVCVPCSNKLGITSDRFCSAQKSDVPLEAVLVPVCVSIAVVLGAVLFKVWKDCRRVQKLLDNETAVSQIAECIAALDFEAVEDYGQLAEPSRMQQSLLLLAAVVKRYSQFMPMWLFKADHPILACAAMSCSVRRSSVSTRTGTREIDVGVWVPPIRPGALSATSLALVYVTMSGFVGRNVFSLATAFEHHAGVRFSSEAVLPIVEAYREFFDELVAVIDAHGGLVELQSGDRVLISFNGLHSHAGDSPVLDAFAFAVALKFSCESILQDSDFVRQTATANDLAAPNIALGIAVGSATVGTFGRDFGVHNTILSPAVSDAVMLSCAAAKLHSHVACRWSVAESVWDRFSTRLVGNYIYKGDPNLVAEVCGGFVKQRLRARDTCPLRKLCAMAKGSAAPHSTALDTPIDGRLHAPGMESLGASMVMEPSVTPPQGDFDFLEDDERLPNVPAPEDEELMVSLGICGEAINCGDVWVDEHGIRNMVMDAIASGAQGYARQIFLTYGARMQHQEDVADAEDVIKKGFMPIL